MSATTHAGAAAAEPGAAIGPPQGAAANNAAETPQDKGGYKIAGIDFDIPWAQFGGFPNEAARAIYYGGALAPS